MESCSSLKSMIYSILRIQLALSRTASPVENPTGKAASKSRLAISASFDAAELLAAVFLRKDPPLCWGTELTEEDDDDNEEEEEAELEEEAASSLSPKAMSDDDDDDDDDGAAAARTFSSLISREATAGKIRCRTTRWIALNVSLWDRNEAFTWHMVASSDSKAAASGLIVSAVEEEGAGEEEDDVFDDDEAEGEGAIEAICA